MARKGGENRGLFERPAGSGIWWIRYQDAQGKERREKVGSKAAARQLYIKRKDEARRGKKLGPLNRKSLTVKGLVERYAPELETNKRSYKEDERHGALFVKSFGDVAIEELQPGDIEAWKAKRLAGLVGKKKDEEPKPLAPATVNRSLAYLKRLYNLAIRDGLTEKNPLAARKVRLFREENVPERVLSPDEEAAIQPHMSRRDWLAVVIALQTGLRQGEQLPRTRKDLDLKKGLLRIPRAEDGPGQAAGRRKREGFIRLNAPALAAFRELAADHDSGWLFPNRDGSGPVSGSAMFHRFQRGCNAAGVEGVNWHTLRHTFISRLMMLRYPIHVVQKLAGHKSIMMTLRYSHHAPGDEEEALEALGTAFAPPRRPERAESESQGSAGDPSAGAEVVVEREAVAAATLK